MTLHTRVFNEIKMTMWEMKRYLIETVSLALIIYIIFISMFWGLKTVSGDSVSAKSLDELIIGFIMWMFAMISLQKMNSFFYREVIYGTLEQLYLSPYGIVIIVVGRILANMIISFLLCCAILFLCMLTTGRWIIINFVVFSSLMFISIFSLLGIGFIIGGLALLFKRMGYMVQIFSFAIIGLLLLPVYPFTPFSLLPYVPVAYTINASIVSNVQFPPWWYAYLVFNGICYLLLGRIIFSAINKKAKKLNTLAQY